MRGRRGGKERARRKKKKSRRKREERGREDMKEREEKARKREGEECVCSFCSLSPWILMTGTHIVNFTIFG